MTDNRPGGLAVDETGLWELFCKTGLPEAFLALAGSREEQGMPSVSGTACPLGPPDPNSLRDV